MQKSDAPIQISSIQEALDALQRKHGSFEEWLECAYIFSQSSMWSHLEIAASRAFMSAISRPIRPAMLADAAKRFAAGSLGNFNNKSEFELNCQKSLIGLKKLQENIPIDKKKALMDIQNLIQVFDEILILLAEGSPPALTSIAAKLRKRLGRSDLAIRVADIAIRVDPCIISGYVVRGSAYTDMGDFLNASKDLEVAENDSKSRPYAVAAYTRLLIRQGKFTQALSKGEELLTRKTSRPLILLMIAAARGANDMTKYERYMSIAQNTKVPERRGGRILLTRQAIRILIENQQFVTAQELILELSHFDKPSQVKSLSALLEKTKKNAVFEMKP
jgi:tetratricopeptide (TPR) repeat protein